MSDWRGRRVLVTGGAGFLGSHLVEALVARSATVTVLDDFSSGRRENLASVAQAIECVSGRVQDRALVRQVVAGKDLVFHLAANADVPRSVREPELDFESNSVGSFNLLRACAESGIRVVASSSAAVYGPPQYLPMDELHPLRPVSPYGASKVGMEALGFAYAEVYGLPFTAVRIFNSYGERQGGYVMLDLLTKLARRTDVLEVLGTGKQVRSYCHVSDACTFLLAAATSERALKRAINLVGDDVLTIAELAERVLTLLGLSKVTQLRFTGQSWPGDIERLIGSAAWAREHLNFRCTVSLDEGLSRLARWFERSRGVRLGNS